MSVPPRALRHRILLGGAVVPVAVLSAVIGVPASAALVGEAPPVARFGGVGENALFNVGDALPENPVLLRQLEWVRAGNPPAVASGDLRVATFSAGLSRPAPGRLAGELAEPGSPEAERVAETVQRASPDVVLLTDFDVDSGTEAATSFRTNYLSVGTGGQEGIHYPYVYASEGNNGVPSGADLNDDGVIGGAGDSLGPGEFAGQHGMVLFSRHPLDTEAIRTFGDLRWDSLPGNAIPEGAYTDLERSVLRLSSTTHWDIPVRVGDRTVHILAAQPVDPSTGEQQDERQHDEMRFWADYVAGDADYLVDDEGCAGGLPRGADYVLTGDFGTSAVAALGDARPSALATLLETGTVRDPGPHSAGARAADGGQPDATRAARDGSGSLVLSRSDYVLPSAGLSTTGSGVFWPARGQAGSHLTQPDQGAGQPGSPTERRLVWADIELD